MMRVHPTQRKNPLDQQIYTALNSKRKYQRCLKTESQFLGEYVGGIGNWKPVGHVSTVNRVLFRIYLCSVVLFFITGNFISTSLGAKQDPENSGRKSWTGDVVVGFLSTERAKCILLHTIHIRTDLKQIPEQHSPAFCTLFISMMMLLSLFSLFVKGFIPHTTYRLQKNVCGHGSLPVVDE